MNEPKFSIIIPAYNEEGSIGRTIGKIEENVSTPHEIVVVNDCSTDKTREIVEGLNLSNLTLVNNERNEGFVKALMRGFEEAKCGVVLPVMADFCDDYSIIDDMYKSIADGFDMVSGSRYIKGGKRISPISLKSICSRAIGLITHFITGIPTHDISNSFKMFKKELLNGMTIESTSFEVSMEIAIKAYYRGYKITEIPTIWRHRTTDRSKFNNIVQTPRYWKWLKFAIVNRLKKSWPSRGKV